MIRRWHAALACAVGLLVQPAAGRAQAVDYGSLEQIFGEPITTSVTGKPQRASEVPGDLVIITQDDIRRSGATNIPDILQFVTGVDIRRYSFGDSQIGVNGYDSPTNPRLLVMVDGRQTYEDDYGNVAWNTMPVQLSEIRQIEVVKGPNSALFGFNAASGVVNIITFDPLFDTINTATVRGGTQAYGQGEGVATARLGTTAGVRISTGGWTANDFTQQQANAGIAAPRSANFNLDGRWQVSPDVLLRASGGGGDSHSARALSAGLYSYVGDRLSYLRGGAAVRTRLGTVDVDVYRNADTYKYGQTRVSNDLTVVKASDLLKLDAANTVRLGFEYRSNFENAALVGGRLGYDNVAGNAMWEWQVSPSVTITNAVRLDHLELSYAGMLIPTSGRTLSAYNDATITAPSFNSGVVIKLTPVDTLRLLAARGLQVPSLLDLGAQFQVGPLFLVGSPSLAPAAFWLAKIGYAHEFNGLGLTSDVAVFFQRITTVIADFSATRPAVTNGAIVMSAANIGSSNEAGAEFGLRYKSERGYRWNASYRLVAINDDISAATVGNANSQTRFNDGTPRHVVILGAGLTRGAWEGDAAARWQSSYTDYATNGPTHTQFSDGSDIALNARIGWNVTSNLTIAGTAQQFNISRILIPTGSTIERRLIASATVRF